METKRIVITGGPGSGKTTLVSNLEKMGYHCLHEISRQIIAEAQQRGIDQLFLEDPILFSDKLLEGRLQQFHEASDFRNSVLFYDRGLPDITAYMTYLGTSYPYYFDETCMSYRYDEIFVLPPWKEIYQQDNERYESFAEAEKIHDSLLEGYTRYGYQVYDVPVGSVNSRIDFILKNLKLAK